jgi:hypothetical protein
MKIPARLIGLIVAAPLVTGCGGKIEGDDETPAPVVEPRSQVAQPVTTEPTGTPPKEATPPPPPPAPPPPPEPSVPPPDDCPACGMG